MSENLAKIYRVPALLAALSIVGLLSALLADGIWDALSWLCLGAVVATAGWFVRPRRRANHRDMN